MEEKARILVLNVDRDDDIGRKTGISGPIVGKEAIIKCANKFGLADPSDADFNSLFQAVKVFEEIKNKYKAEVAIITGHKNRGIESDKKVTEQLDKVLEKFQADYVIFVTDGTNDDFVMPIVQSKVPILSVKRVVVKQAQQLESGYYQVRDFISQSLEDPKLARIVFGLPAIALVLVAIFGVDGWRIIIGVVGAYLFIKGFKLENYVANIFGELKESLTRKRFAFFTYIVGIAFFIIATFRGYTSLLDFVNIGIFEAAASFLSSSIYFYFISAVGIWLGKSIMHNRKKIKIISVFIFGFAVSLVVWSASEFIIVPNFSIINFIGSIILGFFLVFVALLMEWKY